MTPSGKLLGAIVVVFVCGLLTACMPSANDLIRELQSSDGSRRRHAAERLASFGGAEVIHALAVAAKIEQDVETRKVLTESLHQATLATIRDLIYKLADKSVPTPQPPQAPAEAAIDSLVRMGEPAVFELASFIVEPAQIPASSDRDRAVRNARIALDRLVRADSGLVDRLLRYLSPSDSTAEQFRSAGRALAIVGEQRALPLLFAALSDTSDTADKIIRREAARDSIVAFGPTAMPFSTQRLLQGDRTVAYFLGQLRESALGAVTSALSHPNPGVRSAAAVALGHMGSIGVGPLLGALKDSDEQVRLNAVEALGKGRDARAVAPLIPLLTDNSASVRMSTATALWAMEEQHGVMIQRLVESRNIGALLELTRYICLGHDLCKAGVPNANSRSFRLAAAFAKIGEPAVRPLTEKLTNDRADARASAAIALGEIGRSDAIPPLVRALNHWDAGPAVASALQKLGWRPTTATEEVHLQIARRDRKALEANLPRTDAILLADLRSKKPDALRNAVYAGVGIGSRNFVGEALVFFDSAPNRTIAEVFLNCGDPSLRSAADKWAKANGYRIVPVPGSAGTRIGWGRM